MCVYNTYSLQETKYLLFPGQDIDLRTLDRQVDPRMARMDQDLRGPPPATATALPPPPIPAIVPAPADPRTVNAFNMNES